MILKQGPNYGTEYGRGRQSFPCIQCYDKCPFPYIAQKFLIICHIKCGSCIGMNETTTRGVYLA